MTITKLSSITEVVEKHPETQAVFLQYGLHCIGCMAAMFENIEQGASMHGVDVDALVADLNDALK